jgi:DNA-binding MarR family transcriptional regulator
VLHAVDGGDVSAADLARSADISPAAVSQLLATVDAGGLVERNPATDDRRRRSLALTGAGREALRAASEAVRTPLARLLAELPPPEADALARALPHLEALLTGTAPPARPRAPAPPPPRPRPPRPRRPR